MPKEIKEKIIKKWIARIILGIGTSTLIYFLFENPAQKFGWGMTILGIFLMILGVIIFSKILWTLLEWAI